MARTEESKELAKRIKWLLLLRVVTLSFFFGTAALLRLLNIESDTHSLYSLLIPLLAAYAISIASVVLLPRMRNLKGFAHAQVDFDVLLITVTIWMTGDLVSPFCFLYPLAI